MVEANTLEHKLPAEVYLRFSQLDGPVAEQTDSPIARVDSGLADANESSQTAETLRTHNLNLRRSLVLLAVALSQILLYLAESGNLKFYLFLSSLSIGSLVLGRTRETYLQFILFAPVLILTSTISHNIHGKLNVSLPSLNQKELKQWGIKPRQGREYVRGEVEILEVNRGHTVSSKQATVRFSTNKLLINFPDLPWPPSSLVYKGAKVEGLFEIAPIPENSLPWSYDATLQRRGISYTGKILKYQVVRASGKVDRVEKFIAELTSRLGASYGLDLLNASLLGRGEVLSKDLDELFKRTSTTHLIVVSGFHVGVLSRISELGIIKLIRFYPKIFLFLTAEVIGPLFGLMISTFYGYTIGFSLTVLRAIIALAILTFGKVVFRKANGFALLAVAFIVVQTVWPGSVFEPGCQLTFGALLGLLISSSCLTQIQNRLLPSDTLEAQLRGQDWRVRNFLFSKLFAPIFTCTIVGLTVSPVTLIWFQRFIPLSPIINAVLIPIFTFFVLILGGVALFIYKLAGIVFPVKLTVFLAQKVIDLTEQLERISIWMNFGAREVSQLGAISLALLHLALLFIVVCVIKKLSNN